MPAALPHGWLPRGNLKCVDQATNPLSIGNWFPGLDTQRHRELINRSLKRPTMLNTAFFCRTTFVPWVQLNSTRNTLIDRCPSASAQRVAIARVFVRNLQILVRTQPCCSNNRGTLPEALTYLFSSNARQSSFVSVERSYIAADCSFISRFRIHTT